MKLSIPSKKYCYPYKTHSVLPYVPDISLCAWYLVFTIEQTRKYHIITVILIYIFGFEENFDFKLFLLSIPYILLLQKFIAPKIIKLKKKLPGLERIVLCYNVLHFFPYALLSRVVCHSWTFPYHCGKWNQQTWF